MKIIKRVATILLLLVFLAASFYLSWLSPRYTVPILTYHDFGYAGIQVSPDNFARQMRFIKEKKYNVISLDELLEGIKEREKFTHNSVVITFDDGYQDNYTYAYPLLKKYGFPATIFLITNKIGVDRKFLNWDEIKEMQGSNISFGGHTKNHVYLPEISSKDILWDEISGCKKIIEEHTGKPVGFLSYPRGGFNEEIKALVKKAKYKGACATNRGLDMLDRKDAYELNRISIRNRDNSFSLWAKLSGYYNLFRREREGD
jgi:peptidoglycan/xylan/chitin deacetylase (PgdA/CDA1 family)